MQSQLDDYSTYFDKQSDILETKINENLKCSHGYKNYVAQNILITWVPKIVHKCFLSGFPQANVINPSPKTTICNFCEQIDVSGDILDSSEIVE